MLVSLDLDCESEVPIARNFLALSSVSDIG